MEHFVNLNGLYQSGNVTFLFKTWYSKPIYIGDVIYFLHICQVVAATTRTVGETATAMEALIHEVDITAASSQEATTVAHLHTAKEDTTRG